MSRQRSAVVNWGIGFLLAFVAGSLDRSLRAGLLAGAVAGTVLAAVTLVVYGSSDEPSTTEQRAVAPPQR